MTPTYIPEGIFLTRPVITDLECFFCPEEITPINDINYFIVVIPDKQDQQLNLHTPCFEQFAWLMANYYSRFLMTDRTVTLN